MKAVVAAFNQEKALSRGLLCDCTTDCETDGSICGTNPDSVALNGQPSSYSIYFEELCKYSDAKVQFTGTDIRMNWVSSWISAQFSLFRPPRGGGAGLRAGARQRGLDGQHLLPGDTPC